MRKRIQRVNALIKDELSKILLREVDFPKDILVTITRVETSVDLHQARVYVSAMPDKQIDRIYETLNRRIYDIQQDLNKRLKMRPVPKIKFEKEEKTKEAARVEELLENIRNENND